MFRLRASGRLLNTGARVLLFLLLCGGTSSSVFAAAEKISIYSATFQNGEITLFLPVIYGSQESITNYVLLGWNDLGIHCYNHDFQDLAVLPPYNTIWAQVIKRGNPPQVVTQGIRVRPPRSDNE